ncbi:MAG: SLC13 family permease [Candidatus Hodarchaeota archaeon]
MTAFLQFLIALFFIVTLLLIIFERTHKTLAAMLGAGLCLFLAIQPGTGKNGEALIPDVEHLVEFLEVDLLLVIIGITLMVGVARTTGIFDYIAIVIFKKGGNNQYKLLVALSFLTLLFSAFLDAYLAILLISSITLVGCSALDINPKPFILAEAIFGNLGGTMTRIASPPNLILGGHFDVNFVVFFILTAPFVLISAIVTLVIWSYLFKNEFSKGVDESKYLEVMLINEGSVITDRKDFYLTGIILLLTVLGFVIASFLPFSIELGYIAMTGGFLMVGLVGKNVEHALEKVEWPLVFFLIGLLTIVGIGEKAGILEFLAAPIEIIFENNILGGLIFIQWLNAIVSSILDNIPVASVMTSIMDILLENYPNLDFYPLLASVVIGTNLGGNITPIGSASSVQAVTILNKSEGDMDMRVTFIEFIRVGGIVTLAHLLIGTIYIFILWIIGGII